jgi:hypothetical protein
LKSILDADDKWVKDFVRYTDEFDAAFDQLTSQLLRPDERDDHFHGLTSLWERAAKKFIFLLLFLFDVGISPITEQSEFIDVLTDELTIPFSNNSEFSGQILDDKAYIDLLEMCVWKLLRKPMNITIPYGAYHTVCTDYTTKLHTVFQLADTLEAWIKELQVDVALGIAIDRERNPDMRDVHELARKRSPDTRDVHELARKRSPDTRDVHELRDWNMLLDFLDHVGHMDSGSFVPLHEAVVNLNASFRGIKSVAMTSTGTGPQWTFATRISPWIFECSDKLEMFLGSVGTDIYGIEDFTEIEKKNVTAHFQDLLLYLFSIQVVDGLLKWSMVMAPQFIDLRYIFIQTDQFMRILKDVAHCFPDFVPTTRAVLGEKESLSFLQG